MWFKWWATTAKPDRRGGVFVQVFGASSPLRSKFATFVLVASCIVLALLGIGLSLSVVLEKGPEGEVLVARNGQQENSDPLFEFESLTTAAHHESYSNIHNVEQATDCSASDNNGRAGFGQVYGAVPIQLEWMETSVAQSCHAVDVVLPESHVLDPEGVKYFLSGEDPERPFSMFRERFEMMPVTRIIGFSGPSPDWFADPGFRAQVSRDLVALATAPGAVGTCVDASALKSETLIGLKPFVQHVHDALSARDRQSCLVVSAGALLGSATDILSITDKVVVKAFETNLYALPAQPLASQSWFDRVVQQAQAMIPAERLVLMLGAGGRVWRSGKPGNSDIDYASAMEGMHKHGGSTRFATAPGNLHISYLDGDGHRHKIWMLDAATTHNQLRSATAAGISNIGIWGIGREDPSIWPLFKDTLPDVDQATQILSRVDLADHVRYSGSGPFLDFTDAGASGRRKFQTDPDSELITDVDYVAVPRPFSVRRWGKPEDKTVSLTFDDGPDTAYTGPILEILQQHDVSATFFPVGTQMLREPDMVSRLVGEGHVVGSHSFFHSHLEDTSDSRLRTELNLQSRVFVSLTESKPVLFRAPYVRGPGPISGDIAQKMYLIDQLGYAVVGSDIVPPDWNVTDPQVIADFVVSAVIQGKGNVILLHDGGGDRSATVAALPQIIERLRAEGYRFADLAEMAGLTANQVMPPEMGSRGQVERFAIFSFGAVQKTIRVLFWVVICLGLARALFMLGMAIWRGKLFTTTTSYRPTVTVIVPAYNEEKVISRSLSSVLASRYPYLSVIVVNDGSTDRTETVVKRDFGDDHRVTLLSQRNQGKWKAINTAFGAVKSEVVLVVDADTLIDPDAVAYMVQMLKDPSVGAVAGNVMVGNPRNLLTRLQYIEYTISQNIDRRAFEIGNSMMVVPGALGAWRVSAARKAGLFSPDTMAEDADLTVSVVRAGYRIAYEERAYTYTEAPETIRAFLAQRLRWCLGMMQVAWKHRASALEGRRIGFWTLPDLLIFGVFVPLFSPIVDIFLLVTVVQLISDAVSGGPAVAPPGSWLVVAGYLALPAIEILNAMIAFAFEPRSRMRQLLWLPMQRLVYRPLQTLTVYRAVWRALTGRLANWNKLQRSAAVQVGFEQRRVARATLAFNPDRFGSRSLRLVRRPRDNPDAGS